MAAAKMEGASIAELMVLASNSVLSETRKESAVAELGEAMHSSRYEESSKPLRGMTSIEEFRERNKEWGTQEALKVNQRWTD